MDGKPKTVVVIGAGAIGVCSALYLLRDGHRVILLDREGPGEGASFGNAAVIGEEAVIPVATPGILWKVPGMLMDPLGPLAIRWSYLPRLMPWLLRFVAASREQEVERISSALASLMKGNLAAYEPLVEWAGEPGIIRRTGWLCPYETKEGLERYRPMLELQRRRGVALEEVPAEEIRQMEPALKGDFHRAIYYPNVGYAANNFRLIRTLAETFQREGGELRLCEVRDFEIGDAGPRAVVTSEGPIDCDHVVIAAGAWSKPLAAKLGSRVPLDTERGYHVHLPNPGTKPRTAIYSTEKGFAITPLEDGLRAAGTVELGGLDAPPNWQRAEVLRKHLKAWFPDADDTGASQWMGFRPSMPDSLPVISRAPKHPNAVFAFGHGHCGLMLGARTGQLVADLVAERPSDVDLAPFRADRF
ncbi:MAG: FAD-dependent oxidoreductase [Rhodovibrionaceae bacterium]|nr:FAD-dependent oxidoreductase [Rhodovibrionaceae bacterium]